MEISQEEGGEGEEVEGEGTGTAIDVGCHGGACRTSCKELISDLGVF